MTELAFNFLPINDSYAGKSILITGVTGLVGKALLYKILKSIETIDKVYVLIREKRDKSAAVRYSELIAGSNGLFDHIGTEALSKVVAINASLTAVGMDLTENDRNTIINDVSIVFHSAADVTFDAELRNQVLTNVGGTKEIIDLCRQLRRLDALVYVSTAYSSPLEMVVKERVYDSIRNPLEVLELARNSMITPENAKQFLGNYPNTYSYTKNLGENLVKDGFAKHKLPATIVRPGIVLNSVREPNSGWFDSINSIMGVCLLLATGLVRCFNTKRHITGDLIPVDIVANACIASAARVLRVSRTNSLLVYNCNSACLGALTFGKIFAIFEHIINDSPLLNTLRPCKVLTDDDLLCNRWYQFVTDSCFARCVDLLLALSGNHRVADKKVRLHYTMMRACQPYIGRQWYFTNDKMVRLARQLSDCDRETFNCDIQAIDWAKFINDWLFESRKLLLKEKEGDIERAKRNIKYIKTFYPIAKYLSLWLICYAFYSLIRFAVVSMSSILDFIC